MDFFIIQSPNKCLMSPDYVYSHVYKVLDFYLCFFPNFSVNRIRYLLLARMLRLIRILMHVKRYRAFVATFLTLIPSLMPYLGIIFCVLCIYCSLGEQVYWDRGSSYARLHWLMLSVEGKQWTRDFLGTFLLHFLY